MITRKVKATLNYLSLFVKSQPRSIAAILKLHNDRFFWKLIKYEEIRAVLAASRVRDSSVNPFYCFDVFAWIKKIAANSPTAASAATPLNTSLNTHSYSANSSHA
jgi:hypothetical protein